MRQAHLFVDMQNDFVSGTLASPEDNHQRGGEAAVLGATRYMDIAVQPGDSIYFTLDTHYEDYLETQEGILLPVVHCQKGTEGHEVDGKLLMVAHALFQVFEGKLDVKVMEKAAFGAVNVVNDLETQHEMNPFEKITLMGICTDICVITTAALLKSSPALRNVPIAVYEPGCSGINGELHLQALEVMKSFQVEIIEEVQ